MKHSELAGAKKDDGTGAFRYVCVTLQNRRQLNETERSLGFYRCELFRSGDGIFSLDRNPIWMTPDFPHDLISFSIRFISHCKQRNSVAPEKNLAHGRSGVIMEGLDCIMVSICPLKELCISRIGQTICHGGWQLR